MLGASDSKLCAKKDIIIKKFDDLLKKLGAEELALNISLGKMSAEWKAAMEGWLDSESTYRLRIEQAKEARQGAKFAEQEYEKYREAHKEAKNNYEVGLEKHNKVQFIATLHLTPRLIAETKTSCRNVTYLTRRSQIAGARRTRW